MRKKRKGGWGKVRGMLDREKATKERETWMALYHCMDAVAGGEHRPVLVACSLLAASV